METHVEEVELIAPIATKNVMKVIRLILLQIL